MELIKFLGNEELYKWLVFLIPIIISLISVWISLSNLKLTRYSIESANRPYIVATIVDNTTLKNEKLFVIKNFGNSGAIIDSISFSEELTDKKFSNLLEGLNNVFFAPGQTFTQPLNRPDGDLELVGLIKIQYVNGNKMYNEECKLNSKIVSSRMEYNDSQLNKFENKLLSVLHNGNRQRL